MNTEEERGPVLRTGLQEEDSNSVHTTTQVNPGNLVLLPEAKGVHGGRTGPARSTQSNKKHVWGRNKSACNGMSAFWEEKADDVNNQGKIYSRKEQNIFSDSNAERNERKDRLSKTIRKINNNKNETE